MVVGGIVQIFVFVTGQCVQAVDESQILALALDIRNGCGFIGGGGIDGQPVGIDRNGGGDDLHVDRDPGFGLKITDGLQVLVRDCRIIGRCLLQKHMTAYIDIINLGNAFQALNAVVQVKKGIPQGKLICIPVIDFPSGLARPEPPGLNVRYLGKGPVFCIAVGFVGQDKVQDQRQQAAAEDHQKENIAKPVLPAPFFGFHGFPLSRMQNTGRSWMCRPPGLPDRSAGSATRRQPCPVLPAFSISGGSCPAGAGTASR